jgi:predicted nucleic acid-binding protein
MILTDTSVLIQQERHPDPQRVQTAVNFAAAVCGVTIAEFFTGARSANQEAAIRHILAFFQVVPIPETLWEGVGGNQSLLLSRGLTVPLADTAIATVAVARGVELWTYDIHFTHMAAIIPGLVLFQVPP